jgi:hypothetical protein
MSSVTKDLRGIAAIGVCVSSVACITLFGLLRDAKHVHGLPKLTSLDSGLTSQSLPRFREPRGNVAPVYPFPANGIYPLDLSCDENGPNASLFYNGTCSPKFCGAIAAYSTPTCLLTGTVDTSTAAYASAVSQGTHCNSSCTTPPDPRCTTAFLTQTFANFPGVKAAYCSSRHLVVWQIGLQGSSGNLDNIPFPPAGTVGGQACRTRSASVFADQVRATKFPLWPTLLPVAEATNNINDPGFTDQNPYLTSGTGIVYGLPAAGALGMSRAGGQIFPTFNNNARYTPEK